MKSNNSGIKGEGYSVTDYIWIQTHPLNSLGIFGKFPKPSNPSFLNCKDSKTKQVINIS